MLTKKEVKNESKFHPEKHTYSDSMIFLLIKINIFFLPDASTVGYPDL